MDMVTALFQTLHAGLVLWDDIEKTKYIDRLEQLKKDYYAEFNKDLSLRSDAVLDNVQFELRILAVSFAASVGTKNAAAKS